ncbi:MAG: hypothetical protein CEO22_13 [Candidatus Berkelbacteria bacterium Gr01-1014_85]|uniref:Uncharacterized protein n=1 Tax=Candidatus Berkelbacteria bacterium Gr01-1014_85 TaxID=2017150 RepID=A0A554JDX8_9BACT|nr:MAG: hypothetical protein CEO22_13 [Candidatus Berkelbacteria bacterium Gr01-1014_85]
MDSASVMYHDKFMQERGDKVHDIDAILREAQTEIAEARSGALLTRRTIERSVPIETTGSMSPYEAKLRADLAKLKSVLQAATISNATISPGLSETIASIEQQLEQYDQKTESNPAETNELAAHFGLEDENDPEVAAVLAKLGEQEQKAIQAVVERLDRFEDQYPKYDYESVVHRCRQALVRRLVGHFFQVAQERQVRQNLDKLTASPAEAIRISESLLELLKGRILSDALEIASNSGVRSTHLTEGSLCLDGILAYSLIGGGYGYADGERVLVKACSKQQFRSPSPNGYGFLTEERDTCQPTFFYLNGLFERYPTFMRELACTQEA